MTDHFFSLGAQVIYSERALSGATYVGEYEITGMLGVDGESPQYQLTSLDQSHRRVGSEHEIRYMTASETTELPASLEPEKTHTARKSKPMLTDPTLLAL